MYIETAMSIVEYCPKWASEGLKMILNPMKGDSKISLVLPVKTKVAECLAHLITIELSNPKFRSDINMTLLMDSSLGKSSQFRIVWIIFIERITKLISARLF